MMTILGLCERSEVIKSRPKTDFFSSFSCRNLRSLLNLQGPFVFSESSCHFCQSLYRFVAHPTEIHLVLCNFSSRTPTIVLLLIQQRFTWCYATSLAGRQPSFCCSSNRDSPGAMQLLQPDANHRFVAHPTEIHLVLCNFSSRTPTIVLLLIQQRFTWCYATSLAGRQPSFCCSSNRDSPGAMQLLQPDANHRFVAHPTEIHLVLCNFSSRTPTIVLLLIQQRFTWCYATSLARRQPSFCCSSNRDSPGAMQLLQPDANHRFVAHPTEIHLVLCNFSSRTPTIVLLLIQQRFTWCYATSLAGRQPSFCCSSNRDSPGAMQLLQPDANHRFCCSSNRDSPGAMQLLQPDANHRFVAHPTEIHLVLCNFSSRTPTIVLLLIQQRFTWCYATSLARRQPSFCCSSNRDSPGAMQLLQPDANHRFVAHPTEIHLVLCNFSSRTPTIVLLLIQQRFTWCYATSLAGRQPSFCCSSNRDSPGAMQLLQPDANHRFVAHPTEIHLVLCNFSSRTPTIVLLLIQQRFTWCYATSLAGRQPSFCCSSNRDSPGAMQLLQPDANHRFVAHPTEIHLVLCNFSSRTPTIVLLLIQQRFTWCYATSLAGRQPSFCCSSNRDSPGAMQLLQPDANHRFVAHPTEIHLVLCNFSSRTPTIVLLLIQQRFTWCYATSLAGRQPSFCCSSNRDSPGAMQLLQPDANHRFVAHPTEIHLVLCNFSSRTPTKISHFFNPQDRLECGDTKKSEYPFWKCDTQVPYMDFSSLRHSSNSFDRIQSPGFHT